MSTPPPTPPRKGRKSDPRDIYLAEILQENPGQELIYPLQTRWPGESHTTPDDLRRFANRLRARIGQPWGPFADTPEGRFRIRTNTKKIRIYIWFEPHPKDT